MKEREKPEKVQGMKKQGQEGDRFFLWVVAYSYSYSSSPPLLLLHSEPWLCGIGGRR